MKKFNRNAGITLIALVITIIILLILAAVTIAALTGDNGILTQANNAKERTEQASDVEKIRLAVSEAQIGENGYQKLEQNNLQEAIDSQFEGIDVIVSDNGDGSFTVSIDDKIYKIENNKISELQVDLYINNELDLKRFRDDVNNGNTYEGKYVILTSNITLNTEEEWKPIGYYSMVSSNPEAGDNKPFKGIFNGMGYEINGIYIDTEDKAQGFFGLINNAKILNVIIGKQNNITGIDATAGVVGYACNNSIISNCYNESDIRSKTNYAAGVCGMLKDSTILQCYNSGTIQGNNTIGGITTSIQNGKIMQSYNTGTITGNIEVGGIAGILSINGVISGCYNTGYIDGTERVRRNCRRKF